MELSKLLVILILSSLVFAGNAQSNLYTDKGIYEILDFKWSYPYEKNDYSAYFIKRVLINNDLLIHHFNMDFVIDLKTSDQLYFSKPSDQQLIKSRLPDSLLIYDLMDKLVIKNIHTGKIFFVKRKYKEFGFNRDNDFPYFLIDSILLYKEDKNILFAFDPLRKKQVWKREFPEAVYCFEEYGSGLINLTTRTTFYQLNKSTGEILWSQPIITSDKSSLNSELNRQDNKLYLWAESFGLNVLNLDTRTIESTWLVDWKNPDFTMQMIFDGDSIFARTPMNVYCLSKTTGEVFWVSEDVLIRSEIILTDDYIFFYQRGKEDEVDPLSALSRNTHKVEYAQFTSEKYPPKDPSEGIYHNELDLTTINFLERPYQDKYLLGDDGKNVYCFELIESTD